MGGYYGNVNPDLLALMPLSARRVLEIGCGAGALARAWRARNPAAHLTGIEAHPEAAAAARTAFDRLIEGDAETLPDTLIRPADAAPYDLVVMGDVLEHLAEPERMLARLRGMMAPGGHLALSVPNIAHWSGLRALVEGRWPREAAGLFDRTHRSFFTQESLTALLRAAGFAIRRIRPRNIPLDRAEAARWTDALAALAAATGGDPAALRARAAALQYVVVAEAPGAQPPHPMLRLHQIVMAPDFMTARTTVPARALAAEPTLNVTQVTRDTTLPEGVTGPRVAILQRPRVTDPARMVAIAARAHRAGWVLVIEYDDDPALVARVRGEGDAPETYRRAMRLAHAVQTSTPHLGALFRELTDEVAVFANAVADLAPPRAPDPGAAPLIVHAALNRPGTERVAAQLAPVIAAFPEARFEVAVDRPFFDALPTTRKVFHPRLSYDDYLALLGRADVVLSPLEGRAEELGKSDLKWVEAASRGALMIAAPAVYGATIRDGETGLIAAGAGDWARQLGRALSDPEGRAAMVAAARAEVAGGRMQAHQVARRRDWYHDLWARRAALSEAAIRRSPELGAAVAKGEGRG